MIQEMHLSSNEDWLTFIIESLKGERKIIPIFDDNMNFIVKMHGEQWNGQINYQVATFIVELQNNILSIYNEVCSAKHNISSLKTFNKKLVVGVKVEPGCTELIAQLGDIFQSLSGAIKNMDSKDIKHTAITLGCLFTVTSLGHGFLGYLETVETSKRISGEQASVQESIRAIERIASKPSPYMHYLAKEMGEQDKMEYAGKTYTRQEALTKFPKTFDDPPATSAKTYYADDRFEITSLDFEKNNVHLLKDGKKFPVETRFMPEDDKEALHELYRQADIAQTVPAADIQLSVEVLQGKIIGAAITGLGNPRASARSLADILRESYCQKDGKGLEQATLLK